MSYYKSLEIPNIYCQVLSRQRNNTLPTCIIFLIFIWVVVLSATITRFLIKNGLVIFYTIGKLAKREKIKPVDVGSLVGVRHWWAPRGWWI